MEDEYKAWKENPTPDHLQSLLTAANPTLDSAVQSYGRGNPALRSRAKLLAIGAFKSYDPKKGTKLRTHVMTQLQPLNRHARLYENVVSIPERVSADLYLMNQARQQLTDKLGRDPVDQELADHSGLSTRRIKHIQGFARSEMAESGLHEMDNGEQSTMYPGVNRPDPHQIWLEYVHHDATPVDKQILEWRTGYNGKPKLEVQEIAKRLGLTAGAISQRSAKLARLIAEGSQASET
jgi:DNA-directed RNA polymerase specialized sigma subunit